MSQEILFLIFMIVELCSILLLYQVIIIPKIALKTNSLFEERMLNKSWNIPAMLEDYTEHLTVVFAELIKKLVPSILGGHMSARKYFSRNYGGFPRRTSPQRTPRGKSDAPKNTRGTRQGWSRTREPRRSRRQLFTWS